MTASARLRALVSDFCRLESGLPSDPQEAYHLVSAAIHELGLSIRQAESVALDPEGVREILAPAIRLHGNSPLIHRLQTWPRGYAGDFETIEYLCRAENHAAPGTLSFYIEQVALHSAVTQQHRNKVVWQASEILRASLCGPDPKRILSIACGGSRDLRSVATLLENANVQIYLNDVEQDALDLSVSSLQSLRNRITTVPGDVIRATRQFPRYAPFDLIVAGGLFDYLDDRRLIWLLPKLHACLSAQGALCFTNLASDNPARAWMEYLCNWRIIERSEQSVLELLSRSGLDEHALDMQRDTTGLALLVKIHRAKGSNDGKSRRTAVLPASAEQARPARSSHEAEPALRVAIATTALERDQIRSLRAAAMALEMTSDPSGITATARPTEPWDDSGEFLYAAAGDSVVAALHRATMATTRLPPDACRALRIDVFTAEFLLNSLSISSQPVCLTGHVGGQSLALLYKFHYESLRAQGVQFDFVLVPPAGIWSFEQLGYRRYSGNYHDPTSGARIPMVMILEDVEHLKRVRSPLLSSGAALPCRTDAGDWFAATFPEQSRFLNRRSLEQGAFWSAWSAGLQKPAEGRAPLFLGLNDDDAQLFLHESIVHRFSEGETIVRAGDIGNEMFVVLSGVAEAIAVTEAEHRLLRLLKQGDVFGELGLFLRSERSAYVRAVSDVEVLVVSQQQLSDNLTAMPRVTSQFLLNVVRSLCERLIESTVGSQRCDRD